MKLLVVTLHADPTINPGAEEGGGTHMYVNEIINLLIYKQIEALVITRKASSGEDLFEYGKVKIKRIGLGPEMQWSKNNLDELEDVIKQLIEEELEKQKFTPDIIHSIYWHSGRAAIYLANRYNIPMVHTIISLGLRKQLAGYVISSQRSEMERKIFDRATILIAVSEQERSDLVAYYGVNPTKIIVVGRGVDNIFLKELYDEKGTLLPKLNPDRYIL